jgi:hypothetical protein
MLSMQGNITDLDVVDELDSDDEKELEEVSSIRCMLVIRFHSLSHCRGSRFLFPCLQMTSQYLAPREENQV